jgi:hypothetical protein
MGYWSDGVLECCYKIAGFATITPLLQYSNTPMLQCSEINLKSQYHGGLACFLIIEPENYKAPVDPRMHTGLIYIILIYFQFAAI